MSKGTISVSFVEDALLEAERRGIDTADLLHQAGLNQALLATPQARVSPEQYGKLWHLLAAALDDEFFGMDSHPMRYGSFAMLCHALLDCANLGHALERGLRFLSLVLDDVHGQLDKDGDAARLRLTDRQHTPRIFAHGTIFVILYGLACWLTGRRLSIGGVDFVQPMPDNAAEYRLVFGKQLRFGQAQSCLQLDSKALALPIIRDARAAQDFLRKAPANFLIRYRHRDGHVARIRKLLAGTRFDEWPTFGAVATHFRTTESTLRRRLDAEGLSFREVKDDLRRDMAIDLLCHSPAPIEQIALDLGFKENSAFYRAFKKWTGVSPGAYRLSRQGA